VLEHAAAELSGPALSGVLAPSLFGGTRVVVLDDAQDAAPELGAALVAYAADPSDDTRLLVRHTGGTKGKAWVDKLRKAKTVEVVACERLKPRDLPVFVTGEIRAAGGRADAEVAAAIVDAVGTDLRSLASACTQLVADSPEQRLTAEFVGRYFAGRAEVSSFAIADAAMVGRTAEALERLRWALGAGVPSVLVTSALAASVRRLAKVRGLRPGTGKGEAASIVGVPGWKLDQLRREARGWTSIGLARAVTAVADADADVKGAATDAGYALERAVLAITDARNASAR
jgi:DNA polymerase-3 subunit delta